MFFLMSHIESRPTADVRAVLTTTAGAVGVVIAYIACAVLGRALSFGTPEFAAVWPPSGLVLGLLLVAAPGSWRWLLPAAMAGNLAFDLLFQGRAPAVALGFAGANAVEVALGAWLLGRVRHPGGEGGFRLRTLADVVRFAGVVGLVAAPAGAALGAATLVSAFGGSWPASWGRWYVGDALGMVLLAPLVLALADALRSRRDPGRAPARLPEALAFQLLLVAAALGVYGRPPAWAVPAGVLFPMVVWAAYRFGVAGVSLAVGTITLIAVRGTAGGLGPFAAAPSASHQLMLLQGYMVMSALLGDVLAVTLAERRQAVRALSAANATLERGVGERTAELAEWRDRYLRASAAGGIGVYDLDVPRGELWWDERCRGFWGLDPDGPVTLDMAFAGIHPDDREPTRRALEAALEPSGGGSFREEYRVRPLDGGPERWVRVVGTVTFAGEGAARRASRLVGTVQDVTERRLAEGRLRESEATLRAFYDHAPVFLGVVEATPDGDLEHIYDNPATCRFFGIEPGATAGRTSRAMGTPRAVADRWLEHYRESERTGGPVRFEYAHPGPDGESWLAATVCAIGAGPSGRTRYCYVGEDVTERRRLSAQLEAERGLLDALFDTTPIGLAILDPGYRFLRVNRLLAEINGRPVEDHLGRHVGEIVPELFEAAEPIYRRVLESGEPVLDQVVVGEKPTAPGEPGRWLGNYFPVRLGGEVVGLGIAIVDVTDRERAQEALRASEERFRLAAEAVAGIIYDLDPATGHVERSMGLAEVLGYRPDEVPPTSEWWRGLVHPDDVAASADRVRAELLDPSRTRLNHEYRVRHRDGHYVHVNDRAVALRREDGRLVRLVGCTQDVSRLTLALEQIQAEGRRKDEFLAMLSHELRNLLAPVQNAVSVLALAADDPATTEWSGALIGRQVAMMTRLVDDLLDVSRISKGKITLVKAPLSVPALVGAAVESSRPAIDARRHTLAVSLPAEPVRVEGDLARLTQVVVNLLNNAAKYTPEGGRLALSVEADRDTVLLRVRDDGLGIPAEMLPRVFDLFTQVEGTLDQSAGGLGIGLTLVQRIVALHGGEVSAHSDGPGTGSEFRVRLPRLAPPPAADAAPGRGAGPAAAAASKANGHGATGRLRILVVDDTPDAADTLARILRALGHEVRTAYDGHAALAAAGGQRPEVVLLDLGLPGLDGFEVARRLRAVPELAGTRLVALTGYGGAADRERTREAGFDAHLVKPVQLDALRELLARAASPSGPGRGA
jgi:PAS domain S-box-containing protein